MKKIAILGCENSHADAFLKCISENEKFSDVEVIGVYSNEAEASKALNEKYGVAILNDYADAVGKIDGLVITARHGDNHYKYALPYMNDGIPMFIDKPITVSETEALEFMALLKEKNIRVSGGSSLKQAKEIRELKEDAKNEVGGKTVGGYVRAPYLSKNEYGGFYFYTQHLVEMVCEIFGRFPVSVTAKQNGEQIHVLFHYPDYDCVGLYCDNSGLYYASRMATKGANSAIVPATKEWYYSEFNEFYELLCGNEQTMSYEEFFSPVFIMNAIERSLINGKEEEIKDIRK